MGRLQKLKDLNTQNYLITNTTYNAAGQMTAMSGSVNESRTYNSIGQMTQLSASASGGASVSTLYKYSATQNNGKLTSQVDTASGEEVEYTYDSLNRLATAVTKDGAVPQWGQGFTYDGFGNLSGVAAIKGSAPTLSVAYNASTNRRTSDCADANGNIGEASCAGTGVYFDMSHGCKPRHAERRDAGVAILHFS